MANPSTADSALVRDCNSSDAGSAATPREMNGRNTYGAGPDLSTSTRQLDYEGNPLAYATTGELARFAAFGGEVQLGLYRPATIRKIANPAPLGLCSFALTTFVLGLINVQARGVTTPNIVVALAFGYGGLVQLLAGMWEIAVGNTFGATAFSSYGGFWLSFAIILTPGGFNIIESYGSDGNDFIYAFGFFLMGWFIFTTLLLVCTLRSSVAFFLLFYFLDMAFLLLGISHLYPNEEGVPNVSVNKAGGYFALFAAFMAWYNAFAGIADSSNFFFVLPVGHFPWSKNGRANKAMKSERNTV